jgi:hypothetical protein
MSEAQKPTNDAYRKGWEAIFSKPPKPVKESEK